MTAEQEPHAAGASARPWNLRRALGPLLAYHVLVVLGGFLLLDGVLQGSALERVIGVAMLVAGVVTAIAVVIWTATLAQASGPSRRGDGPPPRKCPRCGRAGRDGWTVCDRCGAPLVWTVRSS
jgi:hypothetical protein